MRPDQHTHTHICTHAYAHAHIHTQILRTSILFSCLTNNWLPHPLDVTDKTLNNWYLYLSMSPIPAWSVNDNRNKNY